ncbi:MAG: hypothetical protein IIC51_11235, partial [Planctomycetes bacterium]|nr:hypothetical protein [Planctomycetota bacterium]
QGKDKPEASVADGSKGAEVEPPSDTEQAITSGETTPPVTAKANGESKTTKTGQRPRDLRAKGAKAKAETETGATA